MSNANEYRNQNILAGHDMQCGFSAGAECHCGVIPRCVYDTCAEMGGDETGCTLCKRGNFATVATCWAIVSEIGGKLWAISISASRAAAIGEAQAAAKAWRKPASIRRIDTVGQMERAQFQVEQFRDWCGG